MFVGDFTKIIPRGVAKFFQFRVDCLPLRWLMSNCLEIMIHLLNFNIHAYRLCASGLKIIIIIIIMSGTWHSMRRDVHFDESRQEAVQSLWSLDLVKDTKEEFEGWSKIYVCFKTAQEEGGRLKTLMAGECVLSWEIIEGRTYCDRKRLSWSENGSRRWWTMENWNVMMLPHGRISRTDRKNSSHAVWYKDELVTCWGQTVKGQGCSETKCDQISTSYWLLLRTSPNFVIIIISIFKVA